MTLRRHLHNILPHQCWCNPVLGYELPGGTQVWFHHDEQGGLPSSEEIEQALKTAIQVDGIPTSEYSGVLITNAFPK